MIQKLVDKGLAYESKGDVYFRVRAFPAYGRLCGQNWKIWKAAPGSAWMS